MIKILLAEDHLMVREGTKSLLEKEEDFEIVGDTGDGHEVLAIIESGETPDIILLDLHTPELDGLSIAKKILQANRNIGVIMLAAAENDLYVSEAFKIGVKGYLLKTVSPAELKFCIRHVAAKRKMICSELGMKSFFNDALLSEERESPAESISLTRREKEILSLISEGFTNCEIADAVFTSKRTVEGHRLSLLQKMDARNAAQLIKKAVKLGLI